MAVRNRCDSSDKGRSDHAHKRTRNTVSGAVNHRYDNAVFELLRKVNISSDNISRHPQKKTFREIDFHLIRVRQQRPLYPFSVPYAVHNFFQGPVQFQRALLNFLFNSRQICLL